MASETANGHIARGLRAFHRESGELSAAKLSTARVLAIRLGGGNEGDALTLPITIAEEHHDVRVETALATMALHSPDL